jgi:hypothetical protein
MIEGRDPIGAAERHAQGNGYIAQRFLVEVAERLLRGVKSFDQPARVISEPAHSGIDQTPAFVCTGRGRFGEVRRHPWPL